MIPDPQLVTVEQRIAETTERLRDSTSLRFDDLFERDNTRLDMVCTFLAVLELIRMGHVRARQSEICVYWTADGDETAQ